MIEKEAFANCYDLKQVVFEPGAAVEEIRYKAFCRSSLESFTAPPSLKNIGALTFSECCNLKTFELNESI